MLPGIIKIFYVNINRIPDFTKPHIPLTSALGETEIELHGWATLTEDSNMTGGEEGYSVTLSFNSCVNLNVDPKAFIAVDAMGNRHLIGNALPHWGQLKKSEVYNPPNGDPTLYKYTFTCPVKKRLI